MVGFKKEFFLLPVSQVMAPEQRISTEYAHWENDGKRMTYSMASKILIYVDYLE